MYRVFEIRNNLVKSINSFDDYDRAFEVATEKCGHDYGAVRQCLTQYGFYSVDGITTVQIVCDG